MKENNDIDNLFKEGLHQDFPVDEKLWQEAESKLSAQNPKGGFWIYLNSFAVLAILGMSMFLRTDNVVSQQGEYEPITIADDSFSHEEVITTKPLIPKEKNTRITNNKTTNISAPEKISDKSLLADNNTVKTPINKVTKNQLTSNKDQIKAKKPLEKSTKPSNLSKKVAPASLLASTDAIQPAFEKQHLDINQIEPGQLNKLSLLGYNWNKEHNPEVPKRSVVNDKLKKMQQKLKPHFFEYELEYYQSIEQEKQLSGLPSSLSEYRNEGEKILNIESYGLNIFRKVKFLHLGVGIHYSQFEEQAAYDITEVENGISVSYDTSYRIINGNYNSNGTPVILIKEEINRIETPTTDINQLSLVVRNKISRIQLPVSLSYRRSWGRIETGLRTAFVFNYLSQKSGAYISNDRSRLLPFNENEQLNSFVYAHRNQFSLGYALNEFFLVGGRFSYEYDLNSFTKDYDSRLQHYGLGLYLRFQPK